VLALLAGGEGSVKRSYAFVTSTKAPPSFHGTSNSSTTFGQDTTLAKETDMLYWALVFLVIALVAGALGFGGIAGASAGIAQILFYVFLVLLLVSLVVHFARGTRVP
jgi:uncharacterized membrane protein YtjA (UPF0391 family)